MADILTLEKNKARALVGAMNTINELLGEESALLYSARFDAMGSQDAHYVMAALVSELARVVEAQEERIAKLEAKSKAPPRRKQT